MAHLKGSMAHMKWLDETLVIFKFETIINVSISFSASLEYLCYGSTAVIKTVKFLKMVPTCKRAKITPM